MNALPDLLNSCGKNLFARCELMAQVWTMGELVVEIMRPEAGLELGEPGPFLGPYPSGAPAIFIDTVARLEHSAGIIGGVGRDDFGQCILRRLEGDGVDCSKVIVNKEKSTGVAFVTYFDDGSRKFIYHIGNTPAAEPKAPAAEDLHGIAYFHIMGCSLMADPKFADEIIKTMYIAKSLGAKISFDPNVRPELLGDASVTSVVHEVIENTSIFMPGVDELLMLTEKSSIESAITACFQVQSIEMTVLKRGAQGCSVYTRNESYDMGVYPVDAVDPTGAGDSFDGGFICGLLEKRPIPEAIKLATSAGSLNTAAFGPMEGNISMDSVKRLIETGVPE
jgi:sugar/nucleoside kinase (ribokinase family)